jgi:hypothetical protein
MGDLNQRFVNLAIKRSNPFCYGCYKRVKEPTCPGCGTDDFMRELEGVGVEYGTNWIVSHLIEQNVSEFNQEEAFDELLKDSYGEETKVGPCTFDTVDLIKTMDPTFYRVSLSDYLSSLESDEDIVSFDGGNSYYLVTDIEAYLESEGV